MNILIVEDNQDSRLVLQKLLEGAGHQVVAAVHGAEALTLAREKVPDIIVSDILMPVMDGYKLCYEVKNDELLRKVPFVFYTATYVDPEDERLAMGLGASRFVIKPQEPEKLLAIINEVMAAMEKNNLPVPESPVDEPLNLFRGFDASLSRKLEKKVRELELYRRIFDNSIEAIFVVDTNNSIIRQNLAQQTMLGYPNQELLGKSPAQFLDTATLARIEKSLQESQIAQGEAVAKDKAGNGIFVDYAIFPIVDEQNQTTEHIWMLRNISRTKETERQLKLFRELVDYSNDAIFVIDPKTGRFADVNERACNRLHYGYDELLTLGVLDVDCETTTMEAWQQHVESMREIGATVFESRHRRKNGTEFPVELSIVYTIRENDQDYIVAIARDITERKEAEIRLQAAQDEWMRTFDAITDIVTMQDTDMRIIRANEAATKMFGLSTEQITGMHCYELFRGIKEPCEGCPIPIAQQTFNPYTAEIEHAETDKIFQVTAVPVFDAMGKTQWIAHFAKDITEHRKLEEQYRQAQKMEAVGRLSGGIAHDFNNLLTTIIGYSELVISQLPADSQLREDITAVYDAGKRAAVLTRQLLTFSRKQVLEMKPLVMTTVVENLGKMLQRLIGEDIELDLRLDQEGARVMADEGQVSQVLMNLAINSRDAMPTGGKLIIASRVIVVDESFVKSHKELSPGKHVLIEVSDTGVGMPREVREKIFEPFFTTKEHGKGTGLGLATAYGIVKQHQGSIEVYSEPGRGTTFKLFFPVAAKDNGTEFETPLDRQPPQGDECILIVDDEPLIRSLAVAVLSPLGYTCLGAENGEDALQMAEAHRENIHLLLSDVIMPGMGGVELAKIFKKKYPDTKILLMSGYPRDISFMGDFSEEDFHFIAKPLAPSELGHKVRAVLDD